MKKTILFFIILISVYPHINAQVQTACRLVYADGEGFTVIRGTEQTYHDLFEQDVIGLELRENDIVITEPDTMLELQVASSNNIIKISENSSFKIETYEEKGGGFFSIAYGRIRARVEKLTGAQSFEVEGISAVCGVRGTDFGYDVIADPSGAEKDLVTRIYCFSGSVEVITKVDESGDMREEILEQNEEITLDTVAGSLDLTTVREPQKIIITGNEMVSLFTKEPEKILTSEKVPEEVVTFWDANNFITTPQTIITMEDVGKAYAEKQFRDKKRLFWGGMGLVLTGTAMELTSFFIRNIADQSSLTFSLSVSGAILIGSGMAGVGASSIIYK